MGNHNVTPLKKYRKMMAQVAIDLGYGDKVVDKILHAESANEIERIMANERMRRL